MSKVYGKSIAISPFRKMVMDLLHFSQKVPSVTIDRRMNLAPLAAARARCLPRPSWSAIFIKGYSIVAARHPVLRQMYMSFPWPRFYESAKNVVSVNICREFEGEGVVMPIQIRSPENRSLAELDAIIQGLKTMPVEACENFQRVRSLSRWPWFVRRFILWGTINLIGRRRAHNLGTFGITSVAEGGAGVLQLVPLATSTLFYGLFDEQHRIDMRLAFDHRVLDGVPAATALANLKKALLGEILDELLTMSKSPILPLPKGRAA